MSSKRIMGMGARANSGGSAAAGGFDFQHRVAAWFSVRILAEGGAASTFGLPSGVTLEWLRCEAGQAVDDALVGTSAGGHLYVQAKRSLDLGKTTSCEFASALGQFIKQLIACRGKGGSSDHPGERELDPVRDRFCLVVGPNSSARIRTHLPRALQRARASGTQIPGQAQESVNERGSLQDTLHLFGALWQAALGVPPTEADTKQFQFLLHIQVLDIENGGADEARALELLSSSVVQDAPESGSAWNSLVTTCAGLARDRLGADREALQRRLSEQRMALKGTPSFQGDVDRLKDHTATMLQLAANFSEIRMSERVLKIRRASTTALVDSAKAGMSMLVVGDPGTGKSGAVHDLVRTLRSEAYDVVFLTADRISADSLSELRGQVGLQHEFVEVLRNWPGVRPGFLVIDALDAARAERTARTLRDLIQLVLGTGRWRVVASIRKFDLRYGTETQRMFRGVPHAEYQDPEFRNVSHTNVPVLSDDEMEQLRAEAPHLHDLAMASLPECKALLRNPFNLRLAAELLDAGVQVSGLTPIRTQVELMDRYWQERVVRTDAQGWAREGILRQACSLMVAQKSLRVRTDAVSDPSGGTALHDLLSSQIIVEWPRPNALLPDRSTLTFSHHVLFDYAVARLVLREEPPATVRRIATAPDMVLVIRPSLAFHFRHLWLLENAHGTFWDLILRLTNSPAVPEVGKVIGPAVAVEMARSLDDFGVLCNALQGSEANRTCAEHAFRHLAGAILANPPPLAGTAAGPWSELIERATGRLSPPIAYAAMAVLARVCDKSVGLTASQGDSAGRAARRLLRFAWDAATYDERLACQALVCVCRTIGSDGAASASLIRECISPEHLPMHGYRELFWLGQEVDRIVSCDAALAKDIYLAAFSYEDKSSEQTAMGRSAILPLSSTRKQDYGMGLYTSAESYGSFLTASPQEAVPALAGVLEAYVAREHSGSLTKVQGSRFQCRGITLECQADYSSIWDAGEVHEHDEEVRMLGTLFTRLSELAENSNRQAELDEMLNCVLRHTRLGVVWRRLLLFAVEHPKSVALRLRELAWAPPLLVGYDTSEAAGALISVVHPLLTDPERLQVERAILAVPSSFSSDRQEAAMGVRDRLLGCLQNGDIVSPDARRLLTELQASGSVPVNDPNRQRFTTGFRDYTKRDYLADRGVRVDEAPNRRLIELDDVLEKFTRDHLNSSPSWADAKSTMDTVQALYSELRAPVSTMGAHQEAKEHAWGSLAAACAVAARASDLPCDGPGGMLLRQVLLDAARNPVPQFSAEADGSFSEHPAWGSPAARVEAAAGLMCLASHEAHIPAVLPAINELRGDPVAAVRYQIAERLPRLYHTSPDSMWHALEQFCSSEQNNGVLQGILAGPLHALAGKHTERVVSLTNAILERASGRGAKTVRQYCVGIFAGLYVWQANARCQGMVEKMLVRPSAVADELTHLLANLRDLLALDASGTASQETNTKDVRARAWRIVSTALQNAASELGTLERGKVGQSFDQWTEGEREKASHLAHIIDAISTDVHLASGAHDERRPEGAKPDDGRRGLSIESKVCFYSDASEVLDRLAETGIARVSHNLLKTLEAYVLIDPHGVFLRIGRALACGRKSGYQFESMGCELFVRLVERYLAEHRELFRDDPQCQQVLLESLDIFVEAGWPEAWQLTYRLDEVFR